MRQIVAWAVADGMLGDRAGLVLIGLAGGIDRVKLQAIDWRG